MIKTLAEIEPLPVCKGSFLFRSACGKCSRCQQNIHEILNAVVDHISILPLGTLNKLGWAVTRERDRRGAE